MVERFSSHQTQPSSSILGGAQAYNALPPMPQTPSFADFAWDKIGSQPTLLKRLNNPPPDAGDEARQYSPSPSPDLEQALIPLGSSPSDDTEQLQTQTRRNPLLDSLAPTADVDMDDMYVDDDVNRPVGANLGLAGKEAQAHSGASLRPQLRKASNGQFNTSKLSASSQPLSNSVSTGVKFSYASQEKPSAGPKTGLAIGNPAPAPGTTLTPVSTRNHTIPPTPPPEHDQLGQTRAAPTHCDSLRAVFQRLQSLLDVVSKPDPSFTSMRDSIQGSKVKSHSVAITAQKAVILSQKSLACAQESLQVAQGAAELARNGKQSWEAAFNEWEQLAAEQFAKQKQLQDAIKKELAALGESIKSLEAEDSQRKADQDALEQQRAHEIAVNALHTASTAGPSSLPTPLPINTASTSTAPIAPPSENQNDPAISAYITALAEQMEALRNEVKELKNIGNSGSSQTTPNTQVPQPTRESQTAGASRSLPEKAMDPKLKEEVLRNKLMSHKKLSTSGSSAAPSRLPSNDLPASTQAQQTAPSGGKEPRVEPVPTSVPEVKVKIEPQEAVRLPFRNPLPSTRQASMQLEYPPTPSTYAETKAVVDSIGALRSSPPHLGVARLGGNTARPLLGPSSNIPSTSDTSQDSQAHLDRQTSGSGNRPISFAERMSHPNAPTPSTGQSVERRLPSMSTADLTKEDPFSVREQTEHMTQEPALPAIATIEDHSSTESSSRSSSSTPAPGSTVQALPPSKMQKGKELAQIRPLQTVTKPPASAQLPPKPAPTPVQAKPASSASQTTAEIIARPRTPSLSSSTMDLAQAISENNRTIPPPAPALPSRGLGVPVSRPSGPIRPLSNADRSYRPGRQQSRSRSPVRGRRDAPHREYDHYSPRRSSRGRNSSLSAGRRRSPVPGRRASPPPFRGRVMKVQGRRSPSPADSASRPAPVAAGIKRPYPDWNESGSAARRRIDEPGPSGEAEAVRSVPASSSESFKEDWSWRADYHPSPLTASRSPTRGAAAGASPLKASVDERDGGRPATTKPYLASRITAGSNEPWKQDDDDDGMKNGWRSPVNTTSPRRSDSPSTSSKPNLIDRFTTARDPASRNNHHLPTRDAFATRPARGRGGRGNGRGGNASGGTSHQSLNDRISSSSGNANRPLLSRIDRVE